MQHSFSWNKGNFVFSASQRDDFRWYFHTMTSDVDIYNMEREGSSKFQDKTVNFQLE
jgi:hypothetical protein